MSALQVAMGVENLWHFQKQTHWHVANVIHGLSNKGTIVLTRADNEEIRMKGGR